MHRSLAIVGASVLVLGLGFSGAAISAEPAKMDHSDASKADPAGAAKGFAVMPILKGNTSASGQKIAYPTGKPEVTAAFATIEPGGQTARHQHPVQEYVQVLEGTVIVQADGGKPRTYKAGEGWLEDVNLTHQAWNKGTVPVKLLIVFMGEEGKEVMTMVK